MNYIKIGLEKGYIKLNQDSTKVTYVEQKKTYVFSDPEEKVRASLYIELIEKYQYQPKLIDLEITVPRRTPSDLADIVVFEDESHKKPFLVVECKKEGISKQEELQAIEQAFGNANSLKALYTAMVSGDVRYVYDVQNFPSRERKKNIIADFPIRFGKPQDWKFKKGDPNWELAKANTSQLMSIFSNSHDIIWEGGKKNPAESFDEMSKLMFCKIRDERDCRKNEYYQFQVKTHEEPKSVAKRIKTIYNKAKVKDPDVFKAKLNLDDEIIYNIVLTLQGVSLTKSDLDAKGRAFETFMGKIFRGELGQFFTPREVVKFMVQMIAPTNQDVIIDPSCGSGGFLLNSLDYVREELYENLDSKEAYREEVDFVRYNLYGIEVNSQIARVAMMDMILHEDGHTNIEHGDGLDFFKKYNPKREIVAEKFTVVLQNPPFGHSIKKEDKKYFDNYSLAIGKKRMSSQILFIERAYQLLKDSGRMGIVIPDSVTTNSTTQYVRDYMKDKFFVEAIVSLPKETFMPSGTGVKTSLLFLKKKSQQEIESEEIEKTKLKKDIFKEHIKELNEKLDKINVTTKTGTKRSEKLKKEYEEKMKRLSAIAYDQKFSYPIFMAVAKHVGYDATGKPSKNDLYSNNNDGSINKHSGILGEYLKFKENPNQYKFSSTLDLIGTKDE